MKNLADIKKSSFEYFAPLANSEADVLKSAMQGFLKVLSEQNLTDLESLRVAMAGLNEALLQRQERELLALFNKQDEIKKLIMQKQELIRQRLRYSFECAEDVIEASDIEHKQVVLEQLNAALLAETRLIDITKESVQNALLSAIEDGENVKETTSGIIAAVMQGFFRNASFSKQKILTLSQELIKVAIELAQTCQSYSHALLDGTIMGAKDGASKLIERLKSQSRFAPDELKLREALNELKDFDSDFIEMLKQVSAQANGGVREHIDEIINDKLDSNLARLKRLSELASQEIKERLEELKASPKVTELLHSTGEKLGELKQNGVKSLSDRVYKMAKEILKKQDNKS